MDTDQPDLDDLDLRYSRVGHIDQGRLCDSLVRAATLLLSGELMPARWRMLPPPEFIEKYGAGPKWSKTQNYHLFLYDGIPLFRIWTNTSASYAWIDMDAALAFAVSGFWEVEDIPYGNQKKCKPFMHRIQAIDTDAVILLITLSRDIYAIRN